ncbi:ras-related and estrogen-regulated growth inhibitor-like isoform X1 [Branchiostoma lanceolatum]|uniref:ras-related and estrogen-regulated growth inhibitor-like isoform X1 n=2 Tax=Branchiostoma lanceolatum TaxID=7740 RepID=UPI0034517347
MESRSYSMTETTLNTRTSYSPIMTQRAKMKKRGNNCNNNRLSDEPQVRVAVVGDSSVGKSALSVRFLARRFLPEYAPAQELLYERQVAVDGHLIPLVVHDTASQVSSPSSIFQADGVLVLYSITNKRSFDTAKKYLEIIATEPGFENLPTVLVGHKSDLQHLRQVAYTHAQQLAWDVGCSFYEVSSESGTESVDHVFHTIIRQVLASRQRRKLSSTKDRRQRSNSITSNLWRKTRAAILEKLRRSTL